MLNLPRVIRHWDSQKHNYILVDEIQEIEEWERTVRSHRTEEDADVIITGSSLTMLSGELSTVLGDEKVYVQASYLIASDETYEREFGRLAEIKDPYPKCVISMTPGIDRSIESGITHLSLRHFLTFGL